LFFQARHVFALFQELLKIIGDSHENDNWLSSKSECQRRNIEPAIEQKLFETDEPKLIDVQIGSDQVFTDFSKIPLEFRVGSKPFDKKQRSESEFVDEKNACVLRVDDLMEKSRLEFSTKSKGFILNAGILFKLLRKCKTKEIKLTGCLNVITALATLHLYKNIVPYQSMYYEAIQFHLLVNLRPFLNPPLDNLASGLWAVVFNCILTESELYKDFWQLAKIQSDSIHERLKQNEQFESAKMDFCLLEQIRSDMQFSNGGGVHFALSNLGSMKNKTSIKIKEHHFGFSFVENRWNSLVFHGITTVDDELSWSITYNSNAIKDDIVDELVQCISNIIAEII
jgi:hypothetical protein